MIFNNKIQIFGKTINFKIVNEKVFNIDLLIVKKPDKEVTGMTSRTFGGQHVIFLDFDGLTFEEMTEELICLQHFHYLSNFYIFKNDIERSYHAICLDKFAMHEAIDIIAGTSADRGFKKAPYLFRQRRWVLRLGEKGDRKKPEYIGIVKSKNNEYEKSTPHKIFIEENYDVKIGKLKNEDGIKKHSEICFYNTGSKC